MKIDFTKSCMFKFKIIPRAEDGMIETNDIWHDHARKNGHFIKKEMTPPAIMKS